MAASVKPTGTSLKLEGDDRAVVAVAERPVDDVDGHQPLVSISSVGAGVAEVEGGVGVVARRHRHRAGAGEAVVGREGRRVDQRVGSAAMPPIAPFVAVVMASVKPTGTSLKLKNDRAAASPLRERLVDDVDGHRRVLQVDRDSVGAGAAEVEGGVGVALRRHRHRAGAAEAVVGRKGCRVDLGVSRTHGGIAELPRPRPAHRSEASPLHFREGEGHDSRLSPSLKEPWSKDT